MAESGNPRPFECPVCFDDYTTPANSARLPKCLRCGHTICAACAQALHTHDPNLACPVCRDSEASAVALSSLKTNVALVSAIDSISSTLARHAQPLSVSKKRKNDAGEEALARAAGLAADQSHVLPPASTSSPLAPGAAAAAAAAAATAAEATRQKGRGRRSKAKKALLLPPSPAAAATPAASPARPTHSTASTPARAAAAAAAAESASASAGDGQGGQVELCAQCGEASASVDCPSCKCVLCGACDRTIHAMRVFEDHVRGPASERKTECALHGQPVIHFCLQDLVPVCAVCVIADGCWAHNSALVPIAQASEKICNQAAEIMKTITVTNVRYAKIVEELRGEAERLNLLEATHTEHIDISTTLLCQRVKNLSEKHTVNLKKVIEGAKAKVDGQLQGLAAVEAKFAAIAALLEHMQRPASLTHRGAKSLKVQIDETHDSLLKMLPTALQKRKLVLPQELFSHLSGAADSVADWAMLLPNLATLPAPRALPFSSLFVGPNELFEMPDGSLLVSDRAQASYRVWLDSSRPPLKLPAACANATAVIAVGDDYVAVVSSDDRVERVGEHAWAISYVRSPWTAVVFHGTLFVSTNTGGKIHQLLADTGDQLRVFGEDSLRNPNSMVLCNDGRELVVGDYGTEQIHVFSTETLEELRIIPVAPFSLSIDGLGRLFIAIKGDDDIVVRCAYSGAVLGAFPGPGCPQHALVTRAGQIILSQEREPKLAIISAD